MARLLPPCRSQHMVLGRTDFFAAHSGHVAGVGVLIAVVDQCPNAGYCILHTTDSLALLKVQAFGNLSHHKRQIGGRLIGDSLNVPATPKAIRLLGFAMPHPTGLMQWSRRDSS